MRSGLLLNLLFSAVVFCLLFFDTQAITGIFLVENSFETIHTKTFQFSLLFAVVYLFFEGMRLVFAGLLAAAGDVFFLLVAGSILVWIGFLLPVYLIVIRQSLSVEYAWACAAIYSMLLCATYAFRFKQGAWRQIEIIESSLPNKESLEQNQ